MRKKIITSFLMIAVGLTSYAQRVDSTVTVEYDTDKYRVVTNKFWSNWYISAGGGAQMYFGDHDKQMAFGDRVVPSAQISIGKWFTPGIGVRIAVNGGNVKGLAGWDDHSATSSPNKNWFNYNGFIKDASRSTTAPYVSGGVAYTGGNSANTSYTLYETEIKYIHFHTDVMFNLSNMLVGYNPGRFYSFIPFAGLGYAHTFNKSIDRERSDEFTLSVGIINNFRLSNALDIYLEARGTIINDRFDQQKGHRWGDAIVSAELGLNYRFPLRTWERPKNTVVRYYSDNSELQNYINELRRENQSLRDQLARTPEGKTVIEKSLVAAPQLITFKINTSILTNAARVNLGFLADVIKQDNTTKYVVTGYADRGTGSVATNKRLSTQRAEVVKKCLVEEFGVSADRIITKYEGGVDNMYYNDPRVSRAVIVRSE